MNHLHWYFVRGEVKLLTDPNQHETQYPRYPLDQEQSHPAEEANEVNQLLK